MPISDELVLELIFSRTWNQHVYAGKLDGEGPQEEYVKKRWKKAKRKAAGKPSYVIDREQGIVT